MIEMRPFVPEDEEALQRAIDADSFHPGEWKADYFKQPGMMTQVIEDSHGPMAFVLFSGGRHDKSLRISCVWGNDRANTRNAKAIIFGIMSAAKQARRGGFTEIVIETKHDKLARFLVRSFGMTRDGDDYILNIQGMN
jgi:hypothetical protein